MPQQLSFVNEDVFDVQFFTNMKKNLRLASALRLVFLCIAFLFAQFSAPSCMAQSPVVASVTPPTGGLGAVIDVRVENASSLITPDATGRLPAVLPFLDGNPLKGSKVEYTDPANGLIRFTLQRNSADSSSKDEWNHVLSGLGPGVRKFNFSVGLESGAPIAAKNPAAPLKFGLIVYPQPRSVLALIALIVLLVVFLVLAATTNMLKDLPSGPGVPERRTYSLGRCQMAWWTFIILTSFIVIWLVTGELSVSSSSLILMGISGATGLSAIIINPSPSKSSGKTSNTSRPRFFADLLDDRTGVAFHRFQMFAWTLVLGIVFISRVVNELAQPTFDSTLLTLMGISSGTYIGFTFPEKGNRDVK